MDGARDKVRTPPAELIGLRLVPTVHGATSPSRLSRSGSSPHPLLPLAHHDRGRGVPGRRGAGDH